MSLSQFVAPREEVKIPKNEPFFVEGLSLSSLAVLVRTHLSDLDAIFDLFQSGADIKTEDISGFLGNLIMQAPGLVANIIAVAANEPDAAPQVQKLPFTVQLDAIMKIGELTFTEPGSVKKCMEQIALLLQQTGATNPLTMAGKKVTRAKRR